MAQSILLSEKERTEIRSLISTDREVDAYRLIREISSPGDDLNKIQQLSQWLTRIDRSKLSLHPIRVAIGGTATLDDLVKALELYLISFGFDPKFYQCTFGTVQQSILDPGSELYRFQPNVIWLFSTSHDVTFPTGPMQSELEMARAAQDQVRALADLWAAAKKNSSAHFIQNNFNSPAARSLGHFEASGVGSEAKFYANLNAQLSEKIVPGVSIFDYEWMTSRWGKDNWDQDRFWHHSKVPFPLDAVSTLAFNAARLIEAISGRAKKCLVLDLDNTLWGGIVGDDGPDGIQIDVGDPIGEIFVNFQKYILSLKSRGVLLAACSKNDEAIARTAFLKHSEMPLRLDDFACFMANWKSKPENIKEISDRLGIGLDSLVFVDDNPVERSLVRHMLPSVSVLELPEDPADFVSALDRQRYFETIQLSTEDRRRTQMYQENAKRTVLREQLGDLDEYLRNLEMFAAGESVSAENSARVVQLINRSNQFNLTAAKTSESQMAALIKNKNAICRCYRLRDRFGDSGLISAVVLIFDPSSKQLAIDTWVMSCRVLQRGMEQFVQNEIASLARRLRADKIIGRYFPSSRNQLVAMHYEALGYLPAAPTDGQSVWELSVSAGAPAALRTHVMDQSVS